MAGKYRRALSKTALKANNNVLDYIELSYSWNNRNHTPQEMRICKRISLPISANTERLQRYPSPHLPTKMAC